MGRGTRLGIRAQHHRSPRFHQVQREAVQDPPPGEDGTALPKVLKAKLMKQAAREKCNDWLVDLVLTSPGGPTAAAQTRAKCESEIWGLKRVFPRLFSSRSKENEYHG
jgi:hypothetical protein